MLKFTSSAQFLISESLSLWITHNYRKCLDENKTTNFCSLIRYN